MTAGELFDIAKIYLPGITRKMFVSFYNKAIERITSDVRICVTSEEITDSATYSTIPQRARRIDRVIAADTSLYKYAIERDPDKLTSNEILVFYDSYGTKLTSVAGVTVEYWKKITDALEYDVVVNVPDYAEAIGEE